MLMIPRILWETCIQQLGSSIIPTHSHTNDSWFVGAGSFGNPGISIPQIPNHTYGSWFVDTVLSIALLFLRTFA